MRRLAIALAAGLAAVSSVGAQSPDSLGVGDRVRVRLAVSREYTGVFIGDVASLSRDTLILSIPGDKATMVLPRLAIAEVAVSDGRESKLARVPSMFFPLMLPVVMAVNASSLHGPHANSLRAEGYVLAGALEVLPVASLLARPPRERWRPVYRWLDASAR